MRKTTLEGEAGLDQDWMTGLDGVATNTLLTGFQQLLKRRGVTHFLVAEIPTNNTKKVEYSAAWALLSRDSYMPLRGAIARQLARMQQMAVEDPAA